MSVLVENQYELDLKTIAVLPKFCHAVEKMKQGKEAA